MYKPVPVQKPFLNNAGEQVLTRMESANEDNEDKAMNRSKIFGKMKLARGGGGEPPSRTGNYSTQKHRKAAFLKTFAAVLLAYL
jgi:hypothetical protein